MLNNEEAPPNTDKKTDDEYYDTDNTPWVIIAVGIAAFLFCIGVGSCTALSQLKIHINVPVEKATP